MDTTTALSALFGWFVVGFAYFAIITFVLGLLVKLWGYARTPAPLPVVSTPAPETTPGVIGRMAADVLVFPNLFRGDKLLWAGSWVFHVCLFFILFHHLRYFTYPVPWLVVNILPTAIYMYVGYLFPFAAVYLLWRRMANSRTLYISTLPDYFALALLGLIGATGVMMTYWVHVDLVEVKAFTLGLLTLHPVLPPMHPLFLTHFLMVMILFIYFPFGKLLHAGGIFFSPSRNQPYYIQRADDYYRDDPYWEAVREAVIDTSKPE